MRQQLQHAVAAQVHKLLHRATSTTTLLRRGVGRGEAGPGLRGGVITGDEQLHAGALWLAVARAAQQLQPAALDIDAPHHVLLLHRGACRELD